MEQQKTKPMPKGRVDTDKIIKYMRDNKLTKKQFAEMCGLNVRNLNTVLDDTKNYTSQYLVKIAKTMKIKVFDLLGV